MALRCKPGDLAVILNGPNRDRFVVVIKKGRTERTPGVWEWYCEMQGGPGKGINPQGQLVMNTHGEIEDRRLRPIRDPGPEAVDEMVKRMPAPSSRERETA